MKNFFITLAIFLLILTLEYPTWISDLGLNPFDYARITDVKYSAKLLDEPETGSQLHVTETLTFDVHAASRSNGYWELWRDLPEQYVDGLLVNYEVLSVTQILEDGTRIKYEESDKLYWDDYDYISPRYGPRKWYHSEGPYNEYSRDYECLLFYIDDVYREEMVFEIEYIMNNPAFRYKDCSELWLTFYSEDTIKYLESFVGEVLIKNSDMPKKGDYEATTYGTNKYDFPFTESTDKHPGYHTFSFDLDKSDLKFNKFNEYLEFTLVSFGADRYKFTENALPNYYSNDYVLDELLYEKEEFFAEEQACMKAKFILLVSSAFISYYIVKNSAKIVSKIHTKYFFYIPNVSYEYFREIPSNLDPNFAANLVFSRHRPKKDASDEYAGVMLSLVRKGYIELEKTFDGYDWTANNVRIVIKYHPPKPFSYPYSYSNPLYEPPAGVEEVPEPTLEKLSKSEEIYFNLIYKHAKGGEITLQSFQNKISYDYENTDTFVRNMENAVITIGINEGYFQKANYKQPKRHLDAMAKRNFIIGAVFLTVVNFISNLTPLGYALGAYTLLSAGCIISAVYLHMVAKESLLLTQFGEDEYVKWRGLYNFLNSETLMSERTVIELPIWEQYLVYATAFGISDKVVKALEIRCPDFDFNTSPVLRNPYYRTTNFRVTSRSFRRSVHRASHTARYGSMSYGGGYSSGHGGFGGYGGGGRGGGGGGGGH